MPTTYAWSKIEVGQEIDTTTGISKKAEYKLPGEVVTPEDLHCSGEDDPQWEEFLNSGAIREYPFPDLPKNYQDSPISFIKNQLRAVEAAAMEVSGTGFSASLMSAAMTGPIEPASMKAPDITEQDLTPANGNETVNI